MKKTNLLFSMILIGSLTTNLMANPSEQAEIGKINSAWANSISKGDIAAVGELYSADAVMLPPSSEILNNRSEIRGYWENLKSNGISNYNLSQVGLEVKGNLAYETALWEATRKTNTGDEITFEGNISNVYEKQADGSWKIKLQSWN